MTATAIGAAKVPGPTVATCDTAAWPVLAWEAEQRAYAAGWDDCQRQSYRCTANCAVRGLRGEITEADRCPGCVATHAAWDRALVEARNPDDLGLRLAAAMVDPPGRDTIHDLGQIMWPRALRRREGLS